MSDKTCKDCGDVYPACNESVVAGFCYRCRDGEMTDDTYHSKVVRTLTQELGYTEEQSYELIHALSPRWTLSAARLAFHEKPELVYIMIEGARRVIRPGQKYYRLEAEESVYEAFRQMGWIIPDTVKLHAYLKCAWLAFLYRSEAAFRNYECAGCGFTWASKIQPSDLPHDISGEAAVRCPACKTKNVLGGPRS